MIRSTIATLFALILLVTGAQAQELNWETDLDLAKNRAAKEGKLLLLHFTADWCRPCKQLKTFVFTSPKVISSINERFVPVQVNTDDNPELVKQYDVDSIPLDIVITPEGRMLQKRQSPKDATNFVRMIEAVDYADTQYAVRNAAISDKIGAVLQEIENGSKPNLRQTNDFAAKSPDIEKPAIAVHSKQLMAKSKTRLVEHTADVSSPQQSTPVPQSAGPERIINDRFFAAKSHPSQPTTEKSSASQPPQKQPQETASVAQFAIDDVKKSVERPRLAQAPLADIARQPMGISNGGEFVPAAKRNPPENSFPASQQNDVVSPTKKVVSENDLVAPKNSSRRSPSNAEIQLPDKPSQARLLKQVEEVPGKIEVESTRPHQLSRNRDSKQNSLVKAKIVADNPATKQRPSPDHANELRNADISIPDLVRGPKQDDIRDTVQKMFKSEQKQSVSRPPQTTSRFGLGGKCPVSLIQNGNWVDGNKKFGCVHRGKTYLFADAEKLSLFQQKPEKYSPILAGFDPVVFHQHGELVEGQEKHGVFMGKAPNHRIVLFTSAQSRDQFQKNPKKFMATVRLAIKQSDSIK